MALYLHPQNYLMSFNTHIKPIPQLDTAKKQQVEQMFDAISGKYDFLNRLLSFRIDVAWRNKLLKSIDFTNVHKVLDIATGTGDVAITIAKKYNVKVTGADISEGMLAVGRQKIAELQLADSIEMIKADAEHLPFANGVYDAATVAFGVRNFENLAAGLSDIHRVLKPGGAFRVLEFSKPNSAIVRGIYGLYFTKILPWIGKKVSGSSSAYTYLPISVGAFPEGSAFCKFLEDAGFKEINYKRLTFGISTLYQCKK